MTYATKYINQHAGKKLMSFHEAFTIMFLFGRFGGRFGPFCPCIEPCIVWLFRMPILRYFRRIGASDPPADRRDTRRASDSASST